MPLQFSGERPPIPPLDLIRRVVPPFPPERGQHEREAFDEQCIPQLIGLERALGLIGLEFSAFERLLDFGCGPGRFLRHLGSLSQTTEINGADIDPQAIEWLRENVPFGRYEVVPHEPPTSYPDDQFDLIVNHSVFTHLPERLQDAWMGELQRITRPGGVLLLSLHSTPQWNQAAHDIANGGDDVESMRAELEETGVLFIADDHFIGSTHPDFYHTTFHAPWYVFERWTTWFDLVAYVPLGSDSQDLVVMRSRGDDAPVQRPIGHGSRPDVPRAVAEAASPPGTAHVAALQQLLVARPRPQTVRGRLKRRLLERDLNRQERINELVSNALSAGVNATTPPTPVADREIQMLRVGLYELGHRMTILSEELRDEFGAAAAEHADPPRA